MSLTAEVFDLFDRAVQSAERTLPFLKTLSDMFPTVWGAVASWAMGALGAFAIIQGVKADRRAKGKRKLTRLELQGIAFLIASHMTFLSLNRLFGVEFDLAIAHAVLIGIMTPWVAGAAIAFLEARGAKAIVDAVRDPTDTGSFMG